MFVARENELKKLHLLLKRKKSSFLAIYGRRRVGKTEIVRYFCEQNKISKVEFAGRVDQNKRQQLKAFESKLKRVYGVQSREPIKDWNDAFYLLMEYLERFSKKEKIVVFIDELPWIDTAKSGFLGELADFWNDFCTQRDNIILIVCGSSASYMLKKVIHNRGALHGRLTDIMPLQQFDLNATKKMLEAQGCRYADKSIVDTYMALGGVAKYLDSLDCSSTPTEAIDSLCFKKDALLKYEYEALFASLFNNSKTHYKIMNALSSKWTGHTQKELSTLSGVSSAYIKKPLKELLASGFISATTKFNQTKRDILYRATDSFSYFHNKWMRGNNRSWNRIVNSQSYRSWAGFAFENICHMHSEHIKKILGISGVETQSHYWNYIPNNKSRGVQIDMMLEHTNGSNNIDIIECKYHNQVFTITKAYREALIKKIEIFNEQTKFRYNIRLIFITAFGMVKNEYYNEIVSLDIELSEVIGVEL
ncbi:archaeal ATPase, fused to C-terminal DUF234 domain [hydrothermal vent metagenome]|uniref:Archaeal ATPase, fused to C-terminal DUF234 domain n=1 Tax=hydrothermal vent metagenome TaxID=652676 RepID=A0A1W1BYV6_9ZZZZ